MRRVAAGLGAIGATVLSALAFASLLLASDAAHAARHAFIVGVSEYKKEKGLLPLNAPANDAAELARVLALRGLDFKTVTLVNDEVKDKATFDAALDRFLAGVAAEDEVVFFFSGHGLYLTGAGRESNYFLLPDAKGQQTYLKDLGTAARQLDTDDKRKQSYQDWIATVAVSEKAVEQAILSRGVKVLIILADACRSLVTATKGASLADLSSIGLPKENTRGVFRLYSASKGQVSFDSPERLTSQATPTGVPAAGKPPEKDDKSAKAAARKRNSLFTQVLLQVLPEPGLEINVLAAKVKVEVREQARRLQLGADQIPDFSDDQDATEFYFFQGDKSELVAARCRTADAELAQLRYGVTLGSIGRDTLVQKRFDLAACGKAAEIEALLVLESQGAGALSGSVDPMQQAPGDTGDPIQQCDARASSPLDPNRPLGIAGAEIQKVALAAMSGEIDRDKAHDWISDVINVCETAVGQRNRVARYKYNLARAHYAMSVLAPPLQREFSLQKASRLYDDAVDLGYAAAYNDLALLHQNGEYFNADGKQQPADRKKASELLQRGANLGHVVAHYNLGMAYKNGELRLDDQQQAYTDFHLVLAFKHLSKAAEGGFVPAVIETALALDAGRGIEQNRRRAIELLELAASRGSWEAMYWLGSIYNRDEREHDRAIVWHARAAESGDSRSQESLADMLQRGDGIPAPQPEAAGRYWRLAADAGRLTAQMQLARLLRDGKVPFRPKLEGRPDAGAEEIRDLFAQAFARGNPVAGLELARLYRTGFPKDRPSDAIPADAERAVALLYETMNAVRSAAADSDAADPQIEVRAAFELMDMYSKGEAKRRDGSSALTQDQIDQLTRDYGDPASLYYVPVRAVGPVNCDQRNNFPVMVWDWKRDVSPTEHQFDWFERRYRCKKFLTEAQKQKLLKEKKKIPEYGVPKETREVFNRLFKEAQKDTQRKKSFADRIAEYIDKKRKAKR
ncbi:MAG: DUF2610 domain-containing protein [Hyphomicrobiaceae bacterium]|nr:DUF2610 domain-containing protein [Hyphomicrobiaceae bacterium]